MILPMVLIPSSLALHFLFLSKTHPIVCFLLAGLIGGCCVFCVLICQGYSRVYRTKWYDRSKKGPDQDFEWCEIQIAMEVDALDFVSGDQSSRFSWMGLPNRFPRIHFLILHLAFLIGGLLLLSSAGSLILQVRTDLANCDNLDYLENLGVLVGGLAVGVAGFSIFYQGRLKARSENRHAWMTSIRKEIAGLIANFPSKHLHVRE